jgi:hypothetical protein
LGKREKTADTTNNHPIYAIVQREEQTESDDDTNKEKMSEAHIHLPLGKWSATTCIDLKLPHAIKCQTCLAADDLTSLGLRKSTSKKKKRNFKKVCTQP